MAEYFNVSIISSEKVPESFWNSRFSLKFGSFVYSGNLTFFQNRSLIFEEYSEDDFWSYEISVDAHCLFKRTDIFEKIKLLTSNLNKIKEQLPFNFCIANIESNDSFSVEKNMPTEEMILKSALIFLPKNKMPEMQINLRHHIFEEGDLLGFYNPKILLFTSSCEKLKVLKESFLTKPKKITHE